MLTVKNADSERPEMMLYGTIGEDFGGISARTFREELKRIPDSRPIDLHIHSDGGSFFDGVAMHSMLTQRRGPVHVVIDGLAASAATLVAMAGQSRTIARHGWMMIHEAHALAMGGADDFRRAAEQLDATNEEIVRIYQHHWLGDVDELRRAIHEETWYDSEAAVAAGLADRVGEQPALAAMIHPRFAYRHTPAALAASAAAKLAQYEARLAALL